MKKKPELLVPASSLEVLKTAVVFGADAAARPEPVHHTAGLARPGWDDLPRQGESGRHRGDVLLQGCGRK